MGAARNGWVKPLAKNTWLHPWVPSNYEAVLAHAAKGNEPIGLRRVHEEIAQTVSPVGTADGDKLRTGQVIKVANPSLDAGKRVWGAQSEDLTHHCCTREPLPSSSSHTLPEDEFERWVSVVSPANVGLDLPRSHKLSNKKSLNSVQILSILDSMDRVHFCTYVTRLVPVQNLWNTEQAFQGFTSSCWSVQSDSRSSRSCVLLLVRQAGRPTHAPLGCSLVSGENRNWPGSIQYVRRDLSRIVSIQGLRCVVLF